MCEDVVCMDHKTVLRTTEYRAILHALGLTPRGRSRVRLGRRWAYRNYFEAGPKDIDMWEGLCCKGLAEKRHSRSRVFSVTEEGMEAADVLRYVPRNLRLKF